MDLVCRQNVKGGVFIPVSERGCTTMQTLIYLIRAEYVECRHIGRLNECQLRLPSFNGRTSDLC